MMSSSTPHRGPATPLNLQLHNHLYDLRRRLLLIIFLQLVKRPYIHAVLEEPLQPLFELFERQREMCCVIFEGLIL